AAKAKRMNIGSPGANFVLSSIHVKGETAVLLAPQPDEIAYAISRSRVSSTPQFTTAPDILMIGAHLASSAAMNAAVSFGPRPSVGSTPASCSRLNTFGSSSAVLIPPASLSTTGCGVPAGARIAFQV